MNNAIGRCLAAILSPALCAGAGLLCCAAANSGLTNAGFWDTFLLLTGFAAGGGLLLLFAVHAFRDRSDPGVLCAALAVFLFLAGRQPGQSASAELSLRSLEGFCSLCLPLSLSMLLLFLSSRGGRARSVLWVLAALHLCVSLPALARVPASVDPLSLSDPSLSAYTGLAGLSASLILGWLWRKGRFFFRCFLLPAIPGTAVLLLWDLLRSSGSELLSGSIRFDPVLLSMNMLPLLIVAATAALLAAHLREERDRQEAERLLRVREASARSSYETLMSHNEEVRMLRHDMEKHFYALRRLSEGGDPRITRYLDELIEADEAIRPVVQSGGAMLSAILNSSLSRAMDRGITVEILRDQAPDVIPLSDMELCSLMMNVMDNALEAASAPELEAPYIRLELYTKQAFFFLSCENSRAANRRPEEADDPRSRGLGLKIIRQIAERNGGLVQIEPEPERYRIRIALPVPPPGSSPGTASAAAE